MTQIHAYADTATGSIDDLTDYSLLSADAYTSQDYFAHEQRTLFRRSWIFAAFRRDLGKPGDVLPVEIAGQPVLLVRDSGGDLKAYHNVCSHRGSQLVTEALCDRKTIVCPYHAWIYGLDGTLHRARHFAGVDRAELPADTKVRSGLKPVAVAEWLDFVFVNLAEDAEPFAEFLSPLVSHWHDLDLGEATYSTSLRYDFTANWKLIVENFLESYHVPFIHKTLNTYSPFDQRYQVRLSDSLLGIGQNTYQPQRPDGQAPLPTWPMRGGGELAGAEYFSVFPTFLVGVMPDHIFAWSLEATAADTTVEHLNFYFACEEAALSDRFADQRAATLADWKRVNDEDFDIVERLQSGMRSTAFERAIVSHNMERNITQFQRRVIAEAGVPED